MLGAPRTKKNSMDILVNRKTGRPFIAQNERYKQYEKDFMVQIPGMLRGISLNGKYNLKCIYYMPTRRRVDLGNLLAATCDILVKAKTIEDDNSNIIVSHDGSRVRLDRENPRVEIEIMEVE